MLLGTLVLLFAARPLGAQNAYELAVDKYAEWAQHDGRVAVGRPLYADMIVAGMEADARANMEGSQAAASAGYNSGFMSYLYFASTAVPDRRTEHSSNIYGVSQDVPFGKYEGRGLWGLTRTDSIIGGVPQPGVTVPGGPSGMLRGGWLFEPGRALVRRSEVVQSGVITTQINGTEQEPLFEYRTLCWVEFSYEARSETESRWFRRNHQPGTPYACQYDVTVQGPSPLPDWMTPPGEASCLNFYDMLGCSPANRALGEFLADDGQSRLSISSDAEAVETTPEGTRIVYRRGQNVPFPDNTPRYHSVLMGDWEASLLRPHRVWLQDEAIDRNGQRTTLLYDGPHGYLSGVRDSRGRITRYERELSAVNNVPFLHRIVKPGPAGEDLVHELEWTSLPWTFGHFEDSPPCTPSFPFCIPMNIRTLGSMRLPDGRRYQFDYGVWGQLKEVTFPDGAVRSIEYTTPAIYSHPAPYPGPSSNPAASFNERRPLTDTLYPNGKSGPGFVTRFEHYLMPGSSVDRPRFFYHTIRPDGSVHRAEYERADPFCPRAFPAPIVEETWSGGSGSQPTGCDIHAFGVCLPRTGTWNGTGLLTRSVRQYQSEDASPVFGCSARVDSRLQRSEDTREGLTLTTEYQYDSHPTFVGRTSGNPTRVLTKSGNTTLHEIRTSYVRDAGYVGKNLIRLPSRKEIFDGSGQRVSAMDYRYDETPVVGSGAPNLDGSMGNVRGNLTSTLDYADPAGLSQAITPRSSYYDTGAVEVARDPRGARTRYQYDFGDCSPSRKTLTSTMSNELSHPTTTVVDCYTGAVLSVTDPNNQRTCTQYDRLGRPVAIAGPGDSIFDDESLVTGGQECAGGAGGPTSWTDYPPLGQNGPQWTIGHVKDGTADGLQARTFRDGLGRTIQTCDEADPGISDHAWVCNRTAYDSMGRVAQAFVPFFADNVGTTPIAVPGGTQYRKTLYDALARVTSTELIGPQGQSIDRTETSYGTAQYSPLGGGSATGFLTTVTDPNGNKSKSILNLLGHVVETQKQWIGCPGGFCVTRMKPDLLGRVREIRDALNNPTIIVYDGLGRKRELRDPDMGTWFYEYDANNNLTRQTDAKGQVITMQYDALNRLTLQDVPPAGPSPLDVTNTYDGNVPSTCYNCTDRCPTTVDSCDETTKTCRHVGQPCDTPCIPKTCSSPGVTCGSNISDGCEGTISCCSGSGCAPVSCTGCQRLNACGDACINLDRGVEGNCSPCQDCNGSGGCENVQNTHQDVGCTTGPEQCSNADSCNGLGACMPNHKGRGDPGSPGCGVCQQCNGNNGCEWTGGQACWRDADGDGYGAGAPVFCAGCPGGYVTNNSDCYDANANASTLR